MPVHCCQYGRREVTQAAAAARQREKPLREGRDRDILVGALVGMGANAKVRAGRLKDEARTSTRRPTCEIARLSSLKSSKLTALK